MLKTHCVSCCIIKQTHQICTCFTAHCDTFLAFTSSWGFVLQQLFQNLQCGIFSWGYISRIVCWILINCRHVGPDHWRVMILNEWREVFNSVLLVSLQWPVWVFFFFFFLYSLSGIGQMKASSRAFLTEAGTKSNIHYIFLQSSLIF